MKRDYFIRFNIAGFSYYEGAIAFKKLKIGKVLTLKLDPTNTYDKHAVAIYYKDYKLGYIPRDKNRQLSLLLAYDINPFETVVQRVSKEAHPEEQLEVIVYITKEQETD